MTKKRLTIIIAGLFVVWVTIHLPGILYGTDHVPLHASYLTADEQSPINGALHVLEAKSLFGLRNQPTLYYGPVFAIIALPAVIADFVVRLMTHAVTGAGSYKDFIIWSWGGILGWARLIAVVASFWSLIGMYRLFRTKTFNPRNHSWLPYAAAIFLGFSTLFFEYADTFRHWPFEICILVWQLYLLVRLAEDPHDERCRRRAGIRWSISALLTIAIFGIGYLGIMYQIMWLPLMIRWLKAKNWLRLKQFAQYVLAVVMGCALMIWWHPYGFIRTLGLAGIVAPQTSLGAVQSVNIVNGTAHSFWFYLQIIFIDNPLMIILGLVLAFILIRAKKLPSHYVIWTLAITAAANYLVFSIPAHHESRYMLPTVVFMTIGVLLLYSWWCGDEAARIRTDRRLQMAVKILFIISFILSLVQIIGWDRMLAAGPDERRLIIPQILAWQRENRAAKILVQKNWPLGYVHTHDAYVNFVTTYNKGNSDLWAYILSLQPPKNITPINVYYRYLDQPITQADMKAYDHVVVNVPAAIDPNIWSGSPRDQFDYRPWTVWNYAAYQDTYDILK
ncbi:MAG: hypothetical protein KGI59_01435 [Patescibacteria group bacterium]|nr:hypothetical protein [Patescibacteria group bacterium]